MRRPRRDVDAVVASVLVTAGAFASFALLQAIATSRGTTVLSRIAPPDTIGHLWVFFVLVPSLLLLVGVGVPSVIRALVALARGALTRYEINSLVMTAVAVALVVLEAGLRRSGATSLTLLCAVCAWRLISHMGTVGTRLQLPLLVGAAVSLLGLGVYQQRLHAGDPASVAVAPTLFLVSFYATAVGAGASVLGAVAGGTHMGRRGCASLGWMTVYATWIATVQGWGAVSTYGACLMLSMLALWVSTFEARRVDETLTFL
jgi:hypothetical protein